MLVTSSSPAPRSATARAPLERVEALGRAAAVAEHLPAGRRARLASIATTIAWLPNRAAIVGDSCGVRIAAVLIAILSAPASEQALGIGDRAHAAADGERREHLIGGARDDVDERRAALGRGRDVEEADLVGALRVVRGGLLDRIAGVAQLRRS